MRTWLMLAAANGFLAVALGAFGAHGLKKRLAEVGDSALRLGWWETASHYHLAHALALALVACLWGRLPDGALRFAGLGFCCGIALFSGSLYVMTLTGLRALGAVTPLGGIGFLVGWGALLWAAGKA